MGRRPRRFVLKPRPGSQLMLQNNLADTIGQAQSAHRRHSRDPYFSQAQQRPYFTNEAGVPGARKNRNSTFRGSFAQKKKP